MRYIKNQKRRELRWKALRTGLGRWWQRRNGLVRRGRPGQTLDLALALLSGTHNFFRHRYEGKVHVLADGKLRVDNA